MTQRAFRVVAAIGLAAMLSCSLSCTGAQGVGWDSETDVHRALLPVELRIHPLTRLVRRDEDATSSLDLHFELVDRWGHSTKALGELSVTLFGRDGIRNERGDPVRRWVVDLRDPDENARPYDRVTRTYRFLLTEIPNQSVRSDTLRVETKFLVLDGSTLSGEAVVGRDAG